MKGKMRGPEPDLVWRRLGRSEPGFLGRVETIDQDLIKPEIGSEGKTMSERLQSVRVRGLFGVLCRRWSRDARRNQRPGLECRQR